jgi:hypothetical protein
MKQGKPEAMLEAGMSGNLRFDGDPEKSMQFMGIMTEMMDILKPAKD